jgi:hypothetical protein
MLHTSFLPPASTLIPWSCLPCFVQIFLSLTFLVQPWWSLPCSVGSLWPFLLHCLHKSFHTASRSVAPQESVFASTTWSCNCKAGSSTGQRWSGAKSSRQAAQQELQLLQCESTTTAAELVLFPHSLAFTALFTGFDDLDRDIAKPFAVRNRCNAASRLPRAQVSFHSFVALRFLWRLAASFVGNQVRSEISVTHSCGRRTQGQNICLRPLVTVSHPIIKVDAPSAVSSRHIGGIEVNVWNMRALATRA